MSNNENKYKCGQKRKQPLYTKNQKCWTEQWINKKMRPNSIHQWTEIKFTTNDEKDSEGSEQPDQLTRIEERLERIENLLKRLLPQIDLDDEFRGQCTYIC